MQSVQGKQGAAVTMLYKRSLQRGLHHDRAVFEMTREQEHSVREEFKEAKEQQSQHGRLMHWMKSRKD